MTSVLHLISDDDRRGAQVLATELCAALGRLDLPGEVVALRSNHGQAALPVPVAPSSWRARRALARQHDVVLAHGSTTLAAAARIAPGRFVYRSIGDPTFWLDRPRRRVTTGLSMRAAAAVVALYPAAADALAERAWVPPDRLHAIPNGRVPPPQDTAGDTRARARSDLGLPGRAPVLTYVGSLTWEKQVDRLIDAAAALPDTHLVCVGAGPLAEDLDRRALATLGDRWHPVGSVSDPTRHYQAADLVVMASRTEGMPGCVIEAGFAGTGAVVTDVGGLSSLVIDGVSGRVVAPDDHAALVSAIEEALPEADALGAGARAHMLAEHTLDAIAPRWHEVLVSVMDARPRDLVNAR